MSAAFSAVVQQAALDALEEQQAVRESAVSEGSHRGLSEDEVTRRLHVFDEMVKLAEDKGRGLKLEQRLLLAPPAQEEKRQQQQQRQQQSAQAAVQQEQNEEQQQPAEAAGTSTTAAAAAPTAAVAAVPAAPAPQ